jgi:MFS transporter, ACS family, tartrate transporter
MVATTDSPAAPNAIEAAAMRRVAWRIVPFLMLCYFVSFIDRVNAGFAALDMNRDLHLSPAVFGLGGGLFFVSYFIFEVPSNLAQERIGARRWIARIMISWGVVAAAMALIQGPRSYYLMRLLLGAAEAGFFPGVMLYITYWFPAAYRARIVGWFMVAVPISAFLGSPLSAALLGTDGWLGLRGWQWLFILEGAPAVLLGLICLVYLDDRPSGATWLDPVHRDWLTAQLAAEETADRLVPHRSLWRVLTNGRVLALALVLAGTTANSSGLQLWSPQIIKGFGLTNMQTGLATAIPFAIASVAMVWWGRRSDRVGERVWHTVLPLALIAVGLAGALLFHSLVATIVILSLAVIGIYACKGPVWAVSTEWLAAGAAAAGLAQINALSNLAGFGTIYAVGAIEGATGSFSLAMMPLMALAAVSAATMWWLGRGLRAR